MEPEPVDNRKWDEVAEVETPTIQVKDTQDGPTYIIRQYEFAFIPGLKKKPRAKDILTNDLIKFLENELWKDALEIVPPDKKMPNPRVAIQERSFTVVVVCKPKKGNIIPYEALQQVEKPLHERLVDDREPQ